MSLHTPRLQVKYDGKFTISYTTSDEQHSAFRVMPELARLIAAAPELLEASKALVAFVQAAGIAGTSEQPCAVMERAIAKAEGREG